MHIFAQFNIMNPKRQQNKYYKSMSMLIFKERIYILK